MANNLCNSDGSLFGGGEKGEGKIWEGLQRKSRLAWAAGKNPGCHLQCKIPGPKVRSVGQRRDQGTCFCNSGPRWSLKKGTVGEGEKDVAASFHPMYVPSTKEHPEED